MLDHDIGRFVADAEALHSYEGTREINTLIVGRAVTGHSAFEELPDVMPKLADGEIPALCHRIDYGRDHVPE